MLRTETMYKSETRRISCSCWKNQRGQLVMHLQEYKREVSVSDPSIVWESFALFNSWSVTVAREECKRATKAAVTRFWDTYFPAAWEIIAARIRVLLTSPGA